jgi:DNA-binding transcriptional ArsR family regulator
MSDSSASYRAIADASRRKILDLLRTQGPLRANEIVAHLPQMSQPAVSKHLRILREARLVQAEKEGRERIYCLNAQALRQVSDWLRHYEALWDERLATLQQLAGQSVGRMEEEQ